MSVTIPTAFVEQFSAQVRILSQQRMSKLRASVMNESAVGEAVAVEFVGGAGIRANVVDTRHGDTPLNNTPHSRRWVYPVDYDYADMIDTEDKVRMLAQPENAYSRVHAAIMGREIDIEIVRALGGTSTTGKDASGSQALPTGNKRNASASGSVNTPLGISDLRWAKQQLDEAEVDEMYPRFAIMQAAGIENLLRTTAITSADYNAVRALVHGEINTFMGFNFIRCERVTNARAFFYAQPAVCLKTWREPSTVADRRPDKRNAMQLYTSGTWGATRLEDAMVFQVSYDNDGSGTAAA